jgi:hypothetical protein
MNRTLLLSRIALLACLFPVAGAAQQAPAPVKPLTHTYRLTYTLTVSEAGKRVGVQHFALTVSGPTNRGTLKLGEKVPVATGSYVTGSKSDQTQFTYLDVGLNVDATVIEDPNGIELHSKVEQSSLAPSQPNFPQDPIVRQMVLDNTTQLHVGTPVTLGSLDIPDTTRHTEVEVEIEVVP